MESLIGNSILFLFWILITVAVDEKEKSKSVILMYIIIYITNILEAVPTVESYIILCIAMFIYFEFFRDKFKRDIMGNFLHKIIDFTYIMFAQYSFAYFTISLIMCSTTMQKLAGEKLQIILLMISVIFLYLSCSNTAKQKYVVCEFSEIKDKMDDVKKYRQYLEEDKNLSNPDSILYVEDNNYFDRGDKYTFINTYYLKNKYIKRVLKFPLKFIKEDNKKHKLKGLARGYSTIEMQLLRTLAIDKGYECTIRRKVYEIIYCRLYFYNLKKYYKRCNCKVEHFKDYLLYLYLNLATCLNKGGSDRIEKIYNKKRMNVNQYSSEELFVLALCFSGKVKWENIMIVYDDIIEELNLDRNILQRLIYDINK